MFLTTLTEILSKVMKYELFFLGHENVWSSVGMRTISLDKIKQHKETIVHTQAEAQEKLLSSSSQPDWQTTQNKEISKHQQAIQNLMFSCIYLCQQDSLSYNNMEPLTADIGKANNS